MSLPGTRVASRFFLLIITIPFYVTLIQEREMSVACFIVVVVVVVVVF